MRFYKFLALATAAAMLSGCVSTTLIQSNPSGADVYINGEYMGKTPYSYSDEKIVFSTNYVRLSKDGYEDLHTSFSRSEEADIGAIVAGFIVYVPWLWALKYKDYHSYELQPADGYVPGITQDKYDQLYKLKKMLDDGLITQEEYDKEKGKILGN